MGLRVLAMANKTTAHNFVDAVDILLGFPRSSIQFGNGVHMSSSFQTGHYTYLRQHYQSGTWGVVVDAVVDSLDGQSANGFTINTSGSFEADAHVWNVIWWSDAP